jgi:hypothetical protein
MGNLAGVGAVPVVGQRSADDRPVAATALRDRT